MQIDLNPARLTTLAIHKVGNKLRNEGVVAAKELFPLDESLSIILQDFFLSPFKSDEFYKFAHETDLSLNEINTFCRNIFDNDREAFLEQSIHMLHHLYAVSVHPHISSGELYIAHFRECQIEGMDLEAIGIFKSEHKETFLKVKSDDDGVQMSAELGINVRKLDKGVLIFNTFADEGFSLLMVDKGSEDARYWRDDFLHVERIQDNSYQTETFLQLTRDFCEEVFSREQERKDQLVFLNKSINYFGKKKAFELDDFKDTLFPTEEYREEFDEFRKTYETNFNLPPAEEGFAISKGAVRHMRRQFKSNIRLDSAIEIRLDPKNAEEAGEFMERGYDEQRGMFFYKLYFKEELD
ncbi:MAG: nucleoid-associated protein [Bacteroidetes bacterium]|nr:MAG: nucleoid-associated protein [Bacteroidota bacterium]